MILTRPTRLIIYLILILLLTTACQSSQDVLPGRLKLAGSTTIEPAAAAVAAAFMSRYPEVNVTVRSGGSTIGVKGVAYGALHIGMASRDLRTEELANWPELEATVIGRDGVAVVISPALHKAGVQQLTLAQIAAIWRGELTNWQEVGGPDRPILAYDRASTSGTRATFAEIVLGDAEAAAPGTAGAITESRDILRLVSEGEEVIAILPLGQQTNDVVGVDIVDQDGQAIAPTAENVASGRYPIVRNLNLVTAGEPEGLVAQFIDFILSTEGQRYVEEAGFVGVNQ